MSALTNRVSFHGVRVTARTKRPFEEVLDRLRAQMGKASIHEIVRLAHDSPDEQAYARQIEARFVGKSGFMIFHEIDHGWIARFGIRERVLRIILGNPLVAITMLREDLSAGLFVPVEVLVAESAEAGTNLTYVQPSTLIAVDPDNAALRAAAAVLDAKLAAMVEVVFGE